MTLMIQSIFPAIDISKIKTSNIKRVILFYLDPKKDIIQFRHFSIKQEVSGINKKVSLPNYNTYISDQRAFEL